jgi:ABC-2 type transport system permease protein
MEIISNITILAIVLTGAALIREREHGTVEHLLVMPLTPFEIMLAKVWANGLVIFLAAAISLTVVVETLLQVPVAGSRLLFLSVPRSTCFSPPRWASSSRPSPARCRSSGCCSSWWPCR